MSSRVPLAWGAATFGRPGQRRPRHTTVEQCQAVIDVFVGKGYKIIDTARVYGNGTSEELIGLLKLPKDAVVDTKLHPNNPGDFAPAKLRAELAESIKLLGPYKIRVLYLHAPDRTVPYEDTLREIDALHKEGLFEEFGLSNFLSWEVAEFVTLANAHGWIKPTVYQGIYNAVDRTIEYELIPALRKYGIAFYAYSPLAVGLLSGKYMEEEDWDKIATGNRWDYKANEGAEKMRSIYRPLLPVLKPLKAALDRHQLTMTQAAFRWLQHHSVLTPKDVVILGASSLQQLETNIALSEEGPLPDEVVKLVDDLWAHGAKATAPWYAKA